MFRVHGSMGFARDGRQCSVLACNHAICLACMADWLSSSAAKDCPACRASVGPALAEVVLQHRDN